MDFTTWSKGNHCAAADIIPGSGRQIWGVLYEVPDYLISSETSGNRKSFDAIEGNNYQQIPIKLRHPNGSPVAENMITYVVRNKRSGICTSLEYVRHIIIGLKHKVPDEYIEYVKSRIISNNPNLEQEIREL